MIKSNIVITLAFVLFVFVWVEFGIIYSTVTWYQMKKFNAEAWLCQFSVVNL